MLGAHTRSMRSGPSAAHQGDVESAKTCSIHPMRFRPFTAVLIHVLAPAALHAQAPAALPSIATKTAGMRKLDGYFPLYWDENAGHLWMEVARLDSEVLWVSGLATGLGSNDIGLDRGQIQDERIVRFRRVGPKILLEQPNYTFRGGSPNPAEIRDVKDAFAPSVLWGFTVGAETGGRVLVDLTDFLVRDVTAMGQRLRPGESRLDPSRSAFSIDATQNFPRNTEIEVELTFVRQNAQANQTTGFFEGVGDVAASVEAATLRAHHSFVALPGPVYEPRVYDARSSFFPLSYYDYTAPLGDQSVMVRRLITRQIGRAHV